MPKSIQLAYCTLTVGGRLRGDISINWKRKIPLVARRHRRPSHLTTTNSVNSGDSNDSSNSNDNNNNNNNSIISNNDYDL